MQWKKQKVEAEKELRKSRRQFKEKRRTRLVRLSERWHNKIKSAEIKNYATMSKKLDYICKLFFKNY